MSEHIGTDYDPYLLIEVAEDEETPPVEVGTSTPVSVVCIPQTNNDLSLITGCSIKSNYSSSTGTTTEEMQYVFHIPAIVWIILFLIFDFIFGRILIEFLIILRQKYGSR